MDLPLFLQSVAAPAAVGLVVAWLLVGRSWSGGPLAHRAAALAVGAAMWAGFLASFGFPWPISSVWMWPIWGVAAACLAYVGVAPRAGKLVGAAQTCLVAGLLVLAIAAIAYPMMGRLVPRTWSQSEHVLSVLALAGAGFPVIAASVYADARLTAIRLGPGLVLWAAGSAAILMELGTARGAQTLGFAAAGLSAIYLGALWSPNRPWTQGASAVLVATLALTGLQQFGYGDETPLWPLLALLSPPLLHAAWARFGSRPHRPAVDWLALTFLSAAPLAATWWILSATAADDPYGYGAYPG